jgi:hypothetical protein
LFPDRAIHHHGRKRAYVHFASFASAVYSTSPRKRLLIPRIMSNKPAIPDWQRASADNAAASPEPEEARAQDAVEAPTPTEDDVEGEDGGEQPSQSSELLEQASRFLEDATIRDAPRERKVAFLQSKGVSTEDIETLLGTEPQEDTHTDLEEVGQRAWSAVSTQPLWPQSNDIDIRRRHQSPQRYQK